MVFISEEFSWASEAQDFFSKLKNQVTIEIGYQDPVYRLTTKLPAEMKESLICYPLSDFPSTKYMYCLLTEDGTYQAGVGTIIVKDAGGLLGSVPVLVKYSEKFIMARRLDSLNITNFTNASANGIISLDDLFEEELQSVVEEAMVDKSICVWGANGWVKVIRVLRYPISQSETAGVGRVWRIQSNRGVLEIDVKRQKLILKGPSTVSTGPDSGPVIRTMYEINEIIRRGVVPPVLLYRYPDNRTYHKHSQTYNLTEEQRRSFYAKFS